MLFKLRGAVTSPVLRGDMCFGGLQGPLPGAPWPMWSRQKKMRWRGSEEDGVHLLIEESICTPGGQRTLPIHLRMPRATKVVIVVLIIMLLYAFFSLLFHLDVLSSFRLPYDSRPLSYPETLNDGTLVYRIAAVTDLDKESKAPDGTWRSYEKQGRLLVAPGVSRVSVDWDRGDDSVLSSDLSSGGRAMELSDLVVFDHRLLTIDDRTGIIYWVNGLSVVPWVILGDGPGNVTKPFKGEWMTVKDDSLWVGGLGKEWTSETGEYVNDHPMWVKNVDRSGHVEHIQWTEIYKMIRRSVGIEWPGYMLHEAVQFSHVHRRWFFLPRRVSREPYNEEADEHRGSNILISCDEYFRDIPIVVRIGTDNAPSTKGFSAFQFVPGTSDNVIVALKSEEKGGHPVASHVTVFDVSGRVLLPDQPLRGAYKFEGLALV